MRADPASGAKKRAASIAALLLDIAALAEKLREMPQRRKSSCVLTRVDAIPVASSMEDEPEIWVSTYSWIPLWSYIPIISEISRRVGGVLTSRKNCSACT